ncbi:hypothetical protein [Paenibacillus chitinolyticus]|uniref:hypothetical protein n=1 Tax=Paenibacillus TaxID=44249 RepID=UPI00089FE827|nr:hypothetical protein [Paenibacillus chitinolyticus]MEC0246120.1 hypothetical protein [Paenibacillus chitinolyticus]SEG74310.1 hypothetical protein SAMN02799616_04693 [Paenibacillus sp. UNC499MF]
MQTAVLWSRELKQAVKEAVSSKAAPVSSASLSKLEVESLQKAVSSEKPEVRYMMW